MRERKFALISTLGLNITLTTIPCTLKKLALSEDNKQRKYKFSKSQFTPFFTNQKTVYIPYSIANHIQNGFFFLIGQDSNRKSERKPKVFQYW